MKMFLPLRRINNTLRIALPQAYARQRGLQQGDHVIWVEDEHGIRLKIIKLEEATELIVQQEIASEEAEVA